MTEATSEHIRETEHLADRMQNNFLFVWKPAARVGFYPSSGCSIQAVFDLDCQAFFFADRGSLCDPQGAWEQICGSLGEAVLVEQNEDFIVFEKGEKRGYFFFLDNNQVVELIRSTGSNLHTYVSVRDGCVEGGNYECTNRWPFLEKVVRLASSQGMDLLVDHSGFLDQYPQYIFGDRVITEIGLVERNFTDHPIGPTRHYQVGVHKPEVYEWVNGNLRLTIEYDSILNHLDELDGAITSLLCRKIARGVVKKVNRCRMAPQPAWFFKPSLNPSWTALDSLKRVFEVAQKRQWLTVGVTAFGEGQHKEFLPFLQTQQIETPLWLRFFHIEQDDFKVIQKSCKRID